MLKGITRKNLTHEVLANIKRYILENRIKPGENIPSERVLAAELGVSCNTVRRALEPLEAVGALEKRPRTGTVLKEVDLSKLSDLLQFLMIRSEHDLADLLEARRAIELGAIEVAAQKATDEDFRCMEMAVSLHDAENEAGRIGVEGDEAFHLAMIQASHNVFIQQFGSLIQAFFTEFSTLQNMQVCGDAQANAEHKEILQHLKNKDADSARTALAKHLS